LMFVGEVAPYIVIGYIVNHYCLMFVWEVAPYIVIGYIVSQYNQSQYMVPILWQTSNSNG
jgi:mannose/fructose/N-acetylgalactosamine-specific phosphotransferase system component IIC